MATKTLDPAQEIAIEWFTSIIRSMTPDQVMLLNFKDFIKNKEVQKLTEGLTLAIEKLSAVRRYLEADAESSHFMDGLGERKTTIQDNRLMGFDADIEFLRSYLAPKA